jgi:hypothetical protein
MKEHQLPTAEQILAHALTDLNRARDALSEAANWLRSDWQPLGSPLTDQQADRRTRMWRAIDTAKNAIDRAKR